MDDKFREWIIEVRRDFHMHPETAYQEVRTTESIKSILNELGIKNHGFEDITGVVGLIKGNGSGKTLALRADIDALPIKEMNDVPYKSRNEGRMHACGHDAHTAIMLGVAKKLMESGLHEQIKGNVKFLFQPAEEGGGGGKKMIERGVLENPSVNWVIAGHMEPQLQVGNVGIHSDPGYASANKFRLVIRGKGGHGGRPHQAIDPIVAGAHFVTALQTVVGRNINPIEAAVITVGRFTAGDSSNIIPEHAELEGTIRAFSNSVREHAQQRIRQITEGMEKTFQIKCDLEIFKGYPAFRNDKEVSAFLLGTASDIFGADNVHSLPPTTGAEDFAYFAQERPSAIIKMGCGNEVKGLDHSLHSPFFDIDEEVLMLGVDLFVEVVKRYLN